MDNSTLFEITLFDPDDTLISVFEKRAIEFREVPVTRSFVVAMDKTIEVISNDQRDGLMEKLESIFIDWLKAKQYRKLQVQLMDTSMVSIDEYNTQGMINTLNSALNVTVFDPEYNNRILNKQKN